MVYSYIAIMIKKILLLLLAVLVVIQFIRPAKNRSTEAQAGDIAKLYPVPDSVSSILKRSCYDCHSNNTAYPWYNNIQPAAWWLANHVNEGKRELNFDEFASYPAKKQSHKLKSLSREVKEEGMPLDSYLWIHRYARLSAQEKSLVSGWADSLQASIALKNNLPPEKEERGKK